MRKIGQIMAALAEDDRVALARLRAEMSPPEREGLMQVVLDEVTRRTVGQIERYLQDRP